MKQLVLSAVSESREPLVVVRLVCKATREILKSKQADVAWKLKAIRSQYENEFLSSLASPKVMYVGFEGGAVYTSERAGKFLVILDESSLDELLPSDELEGIELVKTIEFESEAERSAYLLKRFGPRRQAFRE